MPRWEGYATLPRAWPQFIPSPVERTLAVMLGDGRLLTEHGEYLTPRSYQDISDMMFQNNLQVFIGTVTAAMQDWWSALTADMSTAGREERWQYTELMYAETRTELSAVRIHRKWLDRTGKRNCWQVRELTVSSTWGRAIEPALITDLRAMFDLLQVGVHSTPGKTGAATMKQFWRGKKPSEMRRHYRPSLALISAFEKHAIGSRREAYRPREIFDEAYELDAKNGYCSQSGELPCGKALYFKDGNEELWKETRPDIYCYWAEAWVRIWEPGLAPGDPSPFAVRDEEGKLHWPTSPGLYHCWLWSWEAEEIRKRTEFGEPIECYGLGESWAWTESTEQLQVWRDIMDSKRQEAEAISKEVANLVKVVIVAGIGALGLPHEYLNISTEPTEGSTLLTGPGLPDTDLYMTRVFKDSGTPKHWQMFILGKMNFRIYQELRRCYLDGIPVVACNVDSVITLKRPGWGKEPTEAKLGEFKIKPLGGWVACPGPGMILAPDVKMVKIPGMSQSQKRRAMGLYRIGEKEIPRRGEKPRNVGQRERESWRKAAQSMQAYILKYASA